MTASTPALEIPFFKPHLAGSEMAYVAEAVQSGHLAGNGPFTARCVELLRELTGRRAFLTSSGTGALELAFMALGLEPGAEVVVPSYTFVSTASCLLRAGLVPVFADVRMDTANLDEQAVVEAIGPRTRAILPVHYAGVAAEMDALSSVAERFGLAVVEDASHAAHARYKGRPLGSIGALGVFSFHQSKNFTSGEGGALVVTDERHLDAIEVRHEIGTDRARFLRGEIAQYTWIDVGSNYMLSDILAAFLVAQLEAADTITSRRRTLYDRYRSAVMPYAEDGRVSLPAVPAGCESNYHFFHCLLETRQQRDALRSYLRERGVGSAAHYSALHQTVGGRRFGVTRTTIANAGCIEARIFRPPFYTDLSDAEQARVIDLIHEFFAR